MSWRDAPLWIEAYDLAAWLLDRLPATTASPLEAVASRARENACALAESAALALTFPAGRKEELEQLDRTIVRLRTDLRLAQRLRLLTESQLRHACDRLAAIGKMVGGWRKRLDRRQPGRPNAAHSSISGEEPPPATA